MPFISINTNIDVEAKKAKEFISAVIDATSKILGKPKSYIVVVLDDGLKMGVGSSDGTGALITARSVGFAGREKEFALKISELTAQYLGIDISTVNMALMDIPMSSVAVGGDVL